MLMTALMSCVCVAVAASQPDEQTEFALGDRGFAVVAAVDAAEADGFSGVVLAADAGEIVAVVATGSADAAIGPGTLFEIASVTKQFTAAAVMTLVQAGKLSLDDPIAKHLPGVPESCSAITVRHLLQHTSGIPGTNSQGGGDDLAAVLPVFLRGGPQHEPGTHFEYWNQGYALLSEIIARASGEPFTAYLRRAIFEPAGMTSTVFTGDEAPEGAAIALGQSGMGPARTALEHPYGEYGFQYRGMGGIVTNVHDLWRWDRALRGTAMLDDASKEAMFTPGLQNYALGWFVGRRAYGPMHQHSGGVRGFGADLRRYPDRDALIVVLCNDDGYRVGDLADEIEHAVFGAEGRKEMPDRPAVDHHPAPAAGGAKTLVERAIGQYKGPAGITLLVEEGSTPDRARARINWGRGRGFPNTEAVLEAEGDGLILDDHSARSRVTPTVVAGTITELTLDAGGREMRFTREK